ncbi:MAG: hypothetical protein RR646_07390 [Erysipelotrichaceae bacterium]
MLLINYKIEEGAEFLPGFIGLLKITKEYNNISIHTDNLYEVMNDLCNIKDTNNIIIEVNNEETINLLKTKGNIEIKYNSYNITIKENEYYIIVFKLVSDYINEVKALDEYHNLKEYIEILENKIVTLSLIL